MTDNLYHHGVLGMKWGVRREEKRAARDTQRQSTLSRLSKDSDENTRLVAILLQRGPKEVNKVLDIIGKKPARTVSNAIDIRSGQILAKSALFTVGALAVGSLLSMAN